MNQSTTSVKEHDREVIDNGKEWYRHWFSLDYLSLYSHRDEEDAALVVDLIERCISVDKDSRILDLCCGDGRHSVEFAKRGYNNITSLDLSAVLLNVGKRRISRQRFNDASVDFIKADMRTLPFSSCFDLVVNLFTSFGYFEDGENKDVIISIKGILKKGGYLFLDYLNKAYVYNNLKPETISRVNCKVVTERRSLVDLGRRIEKKIIIESNGNTEDYLESVRIYSPEELVEMFTQIGFEITNIFGDYTGSSLKENSPRTILVAKKE